MTDTLTSLRTRHLLAGSADALAAAGFGTWTGAASAQAHPLPDIATWKDATIVAPVPGSSIEGVKSPRKPTVGELSRSAPKR
ncbi:MAG: hypothetical protein M3Y67_00970 [Pseudomonadota bacterium]|nr:hypothetical protein [Pseudomonadota bacterium]